ncbi:hypothetical protein V8F20_011115 [Naviculisporaceae sp. PSN 640]
MHFVFVNRICHHRQASLLLSGSMAFLVAAFPSSDRCTALHFSSETFTVVMPSCSASKGGEAVRAPGGLTSVM